jgi:phosphomannomutase
MSAYKKQVAGSHYINFKIQPSKFVNDNKLLFAEGSAIKYICRHPHKGKKDDILKAIHYLEMIIERDYK